MPSRIGLRPSFPMKPDPIPSGLVLQARDRALVAAVAHYRFVKSNHLHRLVAPSVSLRIVQARLQKLTQHRYLKRFFLPVVLDGQHAPPTHRRQPVYAITTHGARLVNESAAENVSPCLATERPSPMTLLHHLVVTDCLVSLAASCREREDVRFENGEHDGILYSKLRAFRQRTRIHNAVVPDGTFTLYYPTSNETLTFYLEVVRADVKGGNSTLLAKMRRYVELHRRNFFRDAYGHTRLRAVLFATTSDARAENLRRVAGLLTQGRRLFWFGSYQEKDSNGVPVTRLTPERILSLPWEDAEKETFPLIQPCRPSPGRSAE